MRSCKLEITLGPALLPFCILQTPLGKPKKQIRSIRFLIKSRCCNASPRRLRGRRGGARTSHIHRRSIHPLRCQESQRRQRNRVRLYFSRHPSYIIPGSSANTSCTRSTTPLPKEGATYCQLHLPQNRYAKKIHRRHIMSAAVPDFDEFGSALVPYTEAWLQAQNNAPQ